MKSLQGFNDKTFNLSEDEKKEIKGGWPDWPRVQASGYNADTEMPDCSCKTDYVQTDTCIIFQH